MVGGEAAAAVEELVSGVRQATDFAEQFRSYSESEKQWKARMEFILRHLADYRDPPDGSGRLDQLLSLSMVWANHLFLGCRCAPLPAHTLLPAFPPPALGLIPFPASSLGYVTSLRLRFRPRNWICCGDYSSKGIQALST